jgi:prevent-host-death family protein
MQSVKASDAKNRFGQLLEMAQAEPVRIQKNGRDVAVILSPDDFQRLLESGSKISPAVAKLHENSVSRWAKVYEALAR